MSKIRKRVWLGWDDGNLFSSDTEEYGLEEAVVSQDLLDAWAEAKRNLVRIEAQVWEQVK